MTTEEAKAIIEWLENGKRRWLVVRDWDNPDVLHRPATSADLAEAGFAPNAECARVMNETQQAHVKEVSELRGRVTGLENRIGFEQRQVDLLQAHLADHIQANEALMEANKSLAEDREHHRSRAIEFERKAEDLEEKLINFRMWREHYGDILAMHIKVTELERELTAALQIGDDAEAKLRMVERAYRDRESEVESVLRTLKPVPDPRLAHALANPPGPRHAREKDSVPVVSQAGPNDQSQSGGPDRGDIGAPSGVVTHRQARGLAARVHLDPEQSRTLMRYIDQQQAKQEQASRDADAELEQALGACDRVREEAASALEALRSENETLRTKCRTVRAALKAHEWDEAYALAVRNKQPGGDAPVAKVGEKCDSCVACLGYTHDRVVVCVTCGNKRCPRASYHGHECSESNEPGQPGSVYGAPAEAAAWVLGDDMCGLKITDLRRCMLKRGHTDDCRDPKSAPQPSATAGEAGRPVLLSELLSALGACRGKLGGSASALAGMLADELEGAK